MVDFSFIFARFLGTDYADKAFVAPGKHHPIDLCVEPAKSNESNLAVVFPVINPLQNLVGENFSSGQKRDTMLDEIRSSLLFVPLKLDFHASHSNHNTQMCTQTMQTTANKTWNGKLHLMSAITVDEADDRQLDWTILRDGGLALYWRPQILAEEIETLQESGYCIVTLAAGDWKCESDMHASLKIDLSFPAYYGNNLNALHDCLSNVQVPDTGGLALVFNRYDLFAKATSAEANEPSTATVVLDIFARASRYHMLFGKRLLILVQSNDPKIEFGNLAGIVPLWNRREWLNAHRGL